ncbi:hypothetical protein [Streptomyces sp. NPDC088789]|uniref:hypothetical protein n=1 Tax=Streptomyces sp. NPDC088789 TaxID=3365899 RepID=UPI00382D67EC
MLPTVLRRRALGDSMERIQPDLIIQAQGIQPSVASSYRALAEHKKAQAYPEAAQADITALHQRSATTPTSACGATTPQGP